MEADLPNIQLLAGECHAPLNVVRQALDYFSSHLADPELLIELAEAIGISDECLDLSFDEVRGMTPAEALLDHRLNRLFATLTDQPRQGLRRAIQACGLGQTLQVIPLFERTFGIEMPLFLLTCRRAAEDRQFRLAHPDASDLVVGH